MTSYQSSLLRLLDERGYIHQATDAGALDTLASREIVPGYIGFDATAPSLHVGSLVQIMMLRRLQQAGHKPIVLMGGGTTKVGDPSGKDESRKMLGPDDIKANIASIRRVFEHFLLFGDGPSDAVMVDNDEWLSPLGYLELLRDVGPHFTINRMMTFDSVKLRLEREQPLTFLEFNLPRRRKVEFDIKVVAVANERLETRRLPQPVGAPRFGGVWRYQRVGVLDPKAKMPALAIAAHRDLDRIDRQAGRIGMRDKLHTPT